MKRDRSLRSPFWSGAALAVCALLTGHLILFSGCTSSGGPSGATVLPPSPSASPGLLVNGRVITPAGTTSAQVGGMPLNVVVSPDGSYAVTTSSSLDSRLCSVRVSDASVVSSIAYATFDNSNPNSGYFYGLAFAPDGTLYAAQGAHGGIDVLNLSSDGTLTRTRTIGPFPAVPPTTSTAAYLPQDQPSGLALDGRGYLYVTNYVSVDIVPGTLPGPSTLSVFRTDGTRVTKAPYIIQSGSPCYPYAIAVKSDGSTTYVASQRDSCVHVLNTTDPTTPAPDIATPTIATGAHPDALVLDHNESRLYVANGTSDTISVIDTASNRVISTVLLRPPSVHDLPGVSPTGLALSPDDKTLYASLGDFNAVAVVDTATATLRGYIPVGWYPTAVAAAPDNHTLLVTNGWGTSAMNPNPQLNYLDPDVILINKSVTPPNYAGSPGPGYVMNAIPGNVSRIDLANALPALETSTAQVVRNTQNTAMTGDSAGNALASLGVGAGKIKHVIYVIKENRGYDQVLGDLPSGNGDSSLTIYGRAITPNQHALAERFILLDNFYNNAPVSGEGWVWCTQSLANEFVIRYIPYVYRLAYATYNVNYDFGGQNRKRVTGGFPAAAPDGSPLSTSPTGQPPISDISAGPNGYLWDKVRAAGISFRNYGFYLTDGVAANTPQNGSSWLVPDNYPCAVGLQPPGHFPVPKGQTPGVSDYDFRKFDFGYADSSAWVEHGLQAAALGLTTTPPVSNATPPQYGYYSNTTTHPAMPSRFAEWNREFQAMLADDPTGGSIPTFMTVRFPRDHTAGTNPGLNSPRAMLADNDYAVGELVEAVSHSPIWESTAIFVIEDDAQFSPDHVDTHRSICFVISPWIRRGTVDSRFYDTNSVLKSIELLLGLTPMSQYDANANPIMAGWDTAPNNNAPYTAILPPKSLIAEVNPPISGMSKNDPRRRLALMSSKMNFSREDAAPVAQLNEILWKTAKGPSSAVPAPRVNEPPGLRRETRSEDDDD